MLRPRPLSLASAAALACMAAVALAAPPPRMEIQIALCETPDAIVHALDLRPREAAYRPYLFDDAALTLLGLGLRLRLRIRAAGGELTLKAADQPCDATRAWPLPSELRALGPIENTVYATRDKRCDVDVQRLPSGQAYVEVSEKVLVARGDPARRALDAHLARAGVAVCADQAGQAGSKLRSPLGPR